MARAFNSLLTIVGALVLLGFLSPASAQIFEPDDSFTLRGVVRTQSGQPLGKATLFFGHLPDSPEWNHDAHVLTDEHGKFEWFVPSTMRGEVRNQIEFNIPLECFAFRDELGWEPMVGDHWEGRQLEGLAARCQVSWVKNDQNPSCSMVAPDIGRIELRLRGPDNKPLKDEYVYLTLAGQSQWPGGAIIFQSSSRTGPGGRLAWQSYSGMYRLAVQCVNVGFGLTGKFQLLPNRLVISNVPPLAPYGRVSGMVAVELLKQGCSISCVATLGGVNSVRQSGTNVDDKGHFDLDGLIPSISILTLEGGTQSSSVTVELAPGQIKTDVILAPTPRPLTAPTSVVQANH